MPRAKVETIVSEDEKYQNVQKEVSQPDGTKSTASYTRPTLTYFKEHILNLSDSPGKDENGKETESPLSEAWRLYCIALDRAATQAVYKPAVQKSTIIKVGPEEVNVMNFPLGKLIKAVNHYFEERDMRVTALVTAAKLTEPTDEILETAEKSIRNWRAFATAREFLLEGYVNDAGEKVGAQCVENAEGELVAK